MRKIRDSRVRFKSSGNSPAYSYAWNFSSFPVDNDTTSTVSQIYLTTDNPADPSTYIVLTDPDSMVSSVSYFDTGGGVWEVDIFYNDPPSVDPTIATLTTPDDTIISIQKPGCTGLASVEIGLGASGGPWFVAIGDTINLSGHGQDLFGLPLPILNIAGNRDSKVCPMPVGTPETEILVPSPPTVFSIILIDDGTTAFHGQIYLTTSDASPISGIVVITTAAGNITINLSIDQVATGNPVHWTQL